MKKLLFYPFCLLATLTAPKLYTIFFTRMAVSFKKINIIFCFLLFAVGAEAQESIYSEISYPFLQKLIDAARTNYPKMKGYDVRLLMAQDNITKAKRTWYDMLAFSLAYSPTNTATLAGLVLTGYQVSLSINLASLLQKPYNIRQTKNELTLVKLDKEEYYINLEAEVKARYYKYIQQLTLLKLQSRTTIDIEANFKQIKYKFEKAEESFENYNKAMIGLTEQKQNIIASEGSLLVAKSALEAIICKKLEDIK